MKSTFLEQYVALHDPTLYDDTHTFDDAYKRLLEKRKELEEYELKFQEKWQQELRERKLERVLKNKKS